MSLNTRDLFKSKDCALINFQKRPSAKALYHYKRESVPEPVYAVCMTEAEVIEILNSPYVEKASIEKICER